MMGILGHSPDFMDAFMMREVFEFASQATMTDIDGMY